MEKTVRNLGVGNAPIRLIVLDFRANRKKAPGEVRKGCLGEIEMVKEGLIWPEIIFSYSFGEL